ncbi:MULTISPECIES: glycosyltransferase [Flavobacterium]|uniref:Streptomycin biosynthesis protein StrF domain-containing protein n=1 Tax=Flavobacterium panici TaxID=2654843 RepID=A0A9N8J6L3_9FLAO|nr:MULTISPECIES: glycosyltransferase [Flavobacterium]UUF14866.1 glycosyltransferase family protein [Flavobacterium panici]CAC9976394.1 hypothetical protein FLAPXU55_04120 [Flavobacterium panici]
MISLIICSRTKVLSEEFTQNISDTIGNQYELILIDNSESSYSIFEAYNLGIQKSKGDLLCFIHDDILFHTKEWGKILESEFKENPNFALIGIAGAKVKTQYPTGWWDCENKYKVVNIIQHEKGKVEKQFFGFTNDNLQEVLVIDGVFMALKRDNNFLFDTDLTGFHNYDLSLSCNVKTKGKKIGVTKKILIEHFSIGTLNKDWFFSIMSFHNKYQKSLRNNNSTSEQEIFAGKKYIDHCIYILGKKKGLIYLLSVFKFSISIKVNFMLGKDILSRLI